MEGTRLRLGQVLLLQDKICCSSYQNKAITAHRSKSDEHKKMAKFRRLKEAWNHPALAWPVVRSQRRGGGVLSIDGAENADECGRLT